MKATFEQLLDFGATFEQLLEFWSNFWATFWENWSNLWKALPRGSFRTSKNSFKEFCFDQGILKDEELLVLYEQYKSPSLDLPYSSYPLFDPDDMEDDKCLAEFRVKNRDLPALAETLQIPAWISCNQRSKAEGTEALWTLLYPFAYPCRYSDMVPRLARPVPVNQRSVRLYLCSP